MSHLAQEGVDTSFYTSKELFELDGLKSDVSDETLQENTIVGLLEQWDLLDVLEEDDALEPKVEFSKNENYPIQRKRVSGNLFRNIISGRKNES